MSHIGMNSAVQEDPVADFSYSRMFAQPLTVGSVRTECFALLNEANRMACHPLRFGYFHRLRKLGYQGRVTTAPFDVLLIGGFPAPLGIAVCKTGIVLRSDVAKVSHDIHHLEIGRASCRERV